MREHGVLVAQTHSHEMATVSQDIKRQSAEQTM